MKKFLLLLFAAIFFVCPLFLSELSLALDSSKIFISPGASFWGGTDSLGRDLLLRSLLGGYLSLFICVFALALTYLLGLLVGSVLSFSRQINHFAVFFVDVFDSIPNFLLVALFSIIINRGLGASGSVFQSLFVMIISIALAAWPPVARNIRLEILQIQGKDYLNATILAGGSPFHIITTHYRRALWPWVRVSLAHNIPQFLLIESVLSFTGFGLSSQYATLGSLIYEGWKNALFYPHLFMVPSLVLCLLVFLLTRLVQAHKEINLF